ncbi:hypothetical protein [Actinacidiphila alni]|uniref:hypothetical protein n=1 Tax=Actinacidiphila alni TaxID=380248 RepID=UPI003452091C
MMRDKIKVLAAAAALAVGAVVATAMPASAAPSPPSGGSWDHTWTTSDSAHGGTVYIQEHGDVVELCDTAADGYAPRVTVYNTDGYELTASDGYGTCVVASASQGGSHDLPEGKEIYVDIWLGPANGWETEHSYLNDH